MLRFGVPVRHVNVLARLLNETAKGPGPKFCGRKFCSRFGTSIRRLNGLYTSSAFMTWPSGHLMPGLILKVIPSVEAGGGVPAHGTGVPSGSSIIGRSYGAAP